MKASFNVSYLFGVLFLIATSCVTSVKFPIRYQAEIKLTEENPKILYVDNFDPAKLNLKNEKETAVYNSGAGNVLTGLLETFSEDKNIEFENCGLSIKMRADSLYQKSSNPDYIKFVCNENGASHLLVLDTFIIFFESHINESQDDYDSEDGSSELKFRDFTVVVQGGFGLYNKDGKLINSSTLEETKHHKKRLVLIRWIEITPAIKKAGKNVDKAAKAIGLKYRAKFYDNIENVSRQYYAGKDFKEVKPLMVNKDWIKAREVLLAMSKSGKPGIPQKKVAHNLGVVYEALGDFESSDYWYEKSDNIIMEAFPIQ